MKSLKNTFKIFILSVLIFGNDIIYAQHKSSKSKLFLRVYNLTGEKVKKGMVVFVNDSLLALNQNNKIVEIRTDTLGFVKTKRSAGHNVLIGALTGAAFGIVTGVSTADSGGFSYTAS